MTEWRRTTVKECLLPLNFAAATKVQARDYRPSGLYPVIDQGHTPIAGWTDDATGLIGHDLPIVVFGDHTRALKFVDFPVLKSSAPFMT